MINVTSEVKIQEVSGQELKVGDRIPPIQVKSHPTWNSLVVLIFGDCPPIAVKASDLRAAVDNACNSNRHG